MMPTFLDLEVGYLNLKRRLTVNNDTEDTKDTTKIVFVPSTLVIAIMYMLLAQLVVTTIAFFRVVALLEAL